MKPLNIVQIIPSIARESSGPSYSVVSLCEALVKLGANVKLLALDWSPLENPPPFLQTFPLGFGPRRLGRSPKLKTWLRQQIDDHKVDVIHSHGMWNVNITYPAEVLPVNESSIPFFLSPRGSASEWAMKSGSKLKPLFWHLYQKRAFMKATCFHATAENEFADIRNLDFDQPVAIVPNGIDVPELKKKALNDKRTLLFLSRIHKKKGLDILLQAWKRVHEKYPNWELHIVGSDVGYHGKSGYEEELLQIIHREKISRVKFLGEQHGDEKRKCFQNADLFVLPSHSENFGIVVAEALAAGTPAISTTGTPWKGLESKDCGWYIDIGVDALEECLNISMSASHDRLTSMGERGRQWMMSDFSWNRVATMMLESYHWSKDMSGKQPFCVRL